MGCDIHFTVERKVTTGDSSTWEDVFSNNYIMRDAAGNAEPYDKNCDDWHERYDKADTDYQQRWKHPLYLGRNYDMFALLAGVRNYGNKVIPISSQRGTPKDCTVAHKQLVDWNDGDGHSHSWVLLSEILDYPHWHKRNMIGFMAESGAHKWIDGLSSVDPEASNIRICFFFDN